MSKQEVTDTITNRLSAAHDKIQQARQLAKTPTNDVTLMAVSKTKPTTDIIDAYHAGQRIFGENYAQELFDKASELAQFSDIEWHYIGPIQSNKTKIIAQASHWVDSVDRIKVAKRLSQHAAELNKTLNILLQVNISESMSKSGLALSEVASFASEVADLPNICLRGLMAIPDAYDDPTLTEKEFLQMKACFLKLKQQYPSLDTLSLGMSNDLDIAISCGSTMVRLGTAIFGARSTN